MEIGLVVHSHTGNTLSVSKIVKEEIEKLGHSVVLEQLQPIDEEGTLKGKFELSSLPDLSSYDLVLIGAPVWGFAPSGVIKEYLLKSNSLMGKKIFVFVTQSLPFPCLGGNGSIKKLDEICTGKGGHVIGTGIVNYTKKKKESKILELLEKLKRALNERTE